MANVKTKAVDYLRVLRQIGKAQEEISRGSIGGPVGGVDRGTRLALGEMSGDLKAIRKALRPSAADERSVL